MSRTALVTGSAGFIGFHLARRLLRDGWRVAGIDALTDYYDPALKRRRLELLEAEPGYAHLTDRIEAPGVLADLMAKHRPEAVLHLAAQAGVRHSIEAPRSYLESNIAGTFELLESARAHPPAHLLIASTSSVYGANEKMPYAECDRADHQMSFYAASKKATEAMAHSYAHLYGLPVTLFRFFTVYGPWGRPDMALFRFVSAMLEGRAIDVYNRGEMMRDFTYIDDLVEGVVRLIDAVPATERACAGDSLSPVAPWRVVNIGNAQPVKLGDFVAAIEAALGMEAEKRLLPMQPGDVPATWADTTLLTALTGHRPGTPLEEGVRSFVDWYLSEYRRTG